MATQAEDNIYKDFDSLEVNKKAQQDQIPFTGNVQNWGDEDWSTYMTKASPVDVDRMAQQFAEFEALEQNPAMKENYGRWASMYKTRMDEEGFQPLQFLERQTEREQANEAYKARLDSAPEMIGILNGSDERVKQMNPETRDQAELEMIKCLQF